jgi:O-antigen ligase
MSTVVLVKILNSQYISFSMESNFSTSGGYGPNQVSAVLGLGALCSLIILFVDKSGISKLIFSGLFLWFTGQAALTFSRGGVVNLVVAAVPFLMIYYRNVFRNVGTFIFSILVVVVTFLVLIPRLNVYTGGLLQQRFEDRDITNRRHLIQGDLDAFLENPLVGVGPGMAEKYYYKYLGSYSAAHTEYTRLLAEHGILGIMAFLFLLAILIRAFFANRSRFSRSMVMTLSFWSLVEMTHSAMRISAISLLIGVATAHFVLMPADDSDTGEEL